MCGRIQSETHLPGDTPPEGTQGLLTCNCQLPSLSLRWSWVAVLTQDSPKQPNTAWVCSAVLHCEEVTDTTQGGPPAFTLTSSVLTQHVIVISHLSVDELWGPPPAAADCDLRLRCSWCLSLVQRSLQPRGSARRARASCCCPRKFPEPLPRRAAVTCALLLC